MAKMEILCTYLILFDMEINHVKEICRYPHHMGLYLGCHVITKKREAPTFKMRLVSKGQDKENGNYRACTGK